MELLEQDREIVAQRDEAIVAKSSAPGGTTDSTAKPIDVVKLPRRSSRLKRFIYQTARVLLDVSGVGLSALGKLVVDLPQPALDTREIPIAIPDLPARFAGLRVAHLTDIHYGSFMSQAGLEQLIRVTNDLRPDLILLTGDYVNRWISETRQAIPLFKQFTAPLGVYAVLGNHDHYAGAAETTQLLIRSGIKPLDHDLEPIQVGGDRLWLLGSGDFIRDRRYDLNERLAGLPVDEPRLVLAHNPDSADLPREHRVDLMLCGHTHGGQIRVPRLGAPVLPIYNRTYDQGLFKLPDMQLFVSRGIGMVGLPMRLNCPPQLPILRLVPAAKPEVQ